MQRKELVLIYTLLGVMIFVVIVVGIGAIILVSASGSGDTQETATLAQSFTPTPTAIQEQEPISSSQSSAPVPTVAEASNRGTSGEGPRFFRNVDELAKSTQLTQPEINLLDAYGFALNVDPDLSYFDHIVPCGMPGSRVTSIARESSQAVSVEQVKPIVARRFGDLFDMTMEWGKLEDLESLLVSKN